MNKFRKNSKIKREHTMIKGLDKALQKVEIWPEVDSILSGVITKRKGTSPFNIQVQYQTDTGLKCLAKYQGSVQEVFIVTHSPKQIRQKIKNNFSLK